MTRSHPLRPAVGLALTLAAGATLAAGPQAVDRLADQLQGLRDDAALPAVAGARFTSDRVTERAAIGVRRVGAETPVTESDLWHIGSITKSFTSLLVGRAVDRGDLRWDSTLGSILTPGRAGAYRDVTLDQLLGHRAGLPPNAPPALTLSLLGSKDPLPAQRQRVLTSMLAVPPAAAPGERFAYSNVGYVIAGAILEARSGRSWEDLMRAEVLAPLGLRSAGFGPPGSAESLSQPRGHRGPAGGPLTPVEPGPGADNPAFLGPAGTLHMSVDDLVRWGQAHLAGERGASGLVRAETFRRLHEPAAGGDYALGWVVSRVGQQRLVWHNGSNTMWYAVVAFDPEADRGVVVVTNGGIAARAKVDAAVRAALR
jgi:CubicO group peptidase (beta-lactamase class C family)